MIKELNLEELKGMTIEQIRTKTKEYKNLMNNKSIQKQTDKNITDILKGKYKRKNGKR